MTYEIIGDTLPAVVCHLEKDESVVAETGGMAWMSPNMKMQTSTHGGLGKAFGRMFAGDKVLQNIYTAENGPGEIAFASSFPGNIVAYELDGSNDIVLQKSAFLASGDGVEFSVFFNKKLSASLFGGEGFIMQRFTGHGYVFAEFDGQIVEKDLNDNEAIVIDTGHLAAMTSGCRLSIQTVPGVTNKLFGGEGLFNTVVQGPGKVWMQTMPIMNVAQALLPYMPVYTNTNQ